jgi:hypothetical protein
MRVRSSKEAARRIYAVAAAQSGLFYCETGANRRLLCQQATHITCRRETGCASTGNLPADGLPGGTATGVVAVAFVVHGPDGAGAGGVYSHSTALGQNLMPERRLPILHMTVPAGGKR